MNLLYANDERGVYPPSWYAATATPLEKFPSLNNGIEADLCIVGGGYTGLSAALAAADAGFERVVLLEAQRVGFGASGRNGGQVGSGQRQDQEVLEAKHGLEVARGLWQIAEDAKAEVKQLSSLYNIDAAWRDGVAHLAWTEEGAREEQRYAEHLRQAYGADHVEPLGRDAARAFVGTEAYHGGAIDWTAGHIHPLRFAFGLARAACQHTDIYEETEALAVEKTGADWHLATPHGSVRARHVILAANGYHGGLRPELSARIMPINNYIIATEPLGDLADQILSQDIAVADSLFVINYFRLSEDRRLLFGGGESYGDRFPRDITAIARMPMLKVFPQLADIGIDFAWGGTLAITPSRAPYFAELQKNLWVAGGYSGQGVALATLGGRIVVEAIRGDRTRFDLIAKMQPPAFPGLGWLRRPLLNVAMRLAAFQDRRQQ